MPKGLVIYRKLGKYAHYIKYFYYLFFRRDILEKKVSYGNKNNDSTVYLVKPDYVDGVEGLLSLIYSQVIYIQYANDHKYIPYVDWKNYNTQYYDGVNNVWEYFFKQVSDFTLEDVYNSKKVILSGWTFKNKNKKELFSEKVFFDSGIKRSSSALIKQYLFFSDEINDLLDEELARFRADDSIGVYIRGTDYVRLKPSGEYVQPDVTQVIPVIHSFLDKYGVKTLFLVTEDGDIYDAITNEFGEIVHTVSFDTFVRGYDGKNYISKSNVLIEDKKLRGQYYLVKMIILSKCRYLISSITQGSKFSYLLNDGLYEDEYIFDLGLYE